MKILVLAGGTSFEREVSLESGNAVASALDEAGHTVVLMDSAESGPDAWQQTGCEIVLPMVHGTDGEDGVLQAQLQSAKLPYVGSSPAASRRTFDKPTTIEQLRTAGLPVANSGVYTADGPLPGHQQRLDQLHLPIVVKPSRQGSSVGISIVRTADQMLPAIQKALAFGEECLVEDYIEGREITVPVIDGDAFPIVEILPATDWYDFNAKYNDQKTDYRVSPSDLPEGISQIAVAACEVFGVKGIARVDLRVDGNGQPRILEVNTIPGMTTHSLVPKSGAERGLSLAQICELAINNELTRADASQSD
ncbi:MAG: D-alanine--D-alanine ligase [Planctomycetaceae bacterium]|nr:D-alanine--D-alanine ligase [Planctomycetaceae bacterium]